MSLDKGVVGCTIHSSRTRIFTICVRQRCDEGETAWWRSVSKIADFKLPD